MENAGWGFLEGQWVRADVKTQTVSRPLRADVRFATLNVLHDKKHPDILHHEIRYQKIFEELCSLEADIIGLNEVTVSFIGKLLQQDWVRERYTVSACPGDPLCDNLACIKHFGNLIISRIPFESLEYIPCPDRDREFHVASFGKFCVASAHLLSFPWINESTRATELKSISDQLSRYDCGIIMGDFNFHRESENANIPAGWSEIPAVIQQGPTWDYVENSMIPKYLGGWNIYNGFGTGFGWNNSLRLDRVLVRGLEVDTSSAQLFANNPIRDQDYLYPSDHFGITFEIKNVNLF